MKGAITVLLLLCAVGAYAQMYNVGIITPHLSGACDTLQYWVRVTDTVFVAPSDKVIRRVTRTIRYIAGMDYIGPVTVVVEYGCPLCGDERTTYDVINEAEPGIWAHNGSMWACASCGTVYNGRRRK